MPAVNQAVLDHIYALSFDLWAVKLYWVAIATLWFYEYFLTLPDEVNYGWPHGRKKTPVFWLYILNRYFAGLIVILTLIIYFLDRWSNQVCVRYGFFKPFEVMTLNFLAELLLTLRVYAVSRKNKAVLVMAALLMMAQWGLIIFVMSQSSQGSNQLALLLDGPPVRPLPVLPNTDPFHVCIFILAPQTAKKVQVWLCTSIVFDGLAFLAILYYTFAKLRGRLRVVPIIRVMRNDGIIYFFVLFASNFICLMVVTYARKGLKYIHLQPSSIIASIMINRITLNLKRTAETESQIMVWSMQTFEDGPHDIGAAKGKRNAVVLDSLPTSTTC